MKIKYLFLSLICITLISCEKEKTNPYDPDSDIDFSPKNLVAEPISPYVIELCWEMTETSIDGFKVDRKIGSRNWEIDIVENIDNNTTSWIDYNCSPNTDYTYRIYAVAGDNTSDYKTIESKTPEGNQTGTFTDLRDGTVYKWVKIGDQIWMAENLAYIPFVSSLDSDYGIWVYGYYDTDVIEAKSTNNYLTKGCLYSWDMANEAVPEGWRLPSDEDWLELINYLGGSSVAGKKLKDAGEDFWWFIDNTATNESGFSALPVGEKLYDNFQTNTITVFWPSMPKWAIDSGMDYQDYMNFTNTIDGVYQLDSSDNFEKSSYYYNMTRGISVRCIKN